MKMDIEKLVKDIYKAHAINFSIKLNELTGIDDELLSDQLFTYALSKFKCVFRKELKEHE